MDTVRLRHNGYEYLKMYLSKLGVWTKVFCTQEYRTTYVNTARLFKKTQASKSRWGLLERA